MIRHTNLLRRSYYLNAVVYLMRLMPRRRNRRARYLRGPSHQVPLLVDAMRNRTTSITNNLQILSVIRDFWRMLLWSYSGSKVFSLADDDLQPEMTQLSRTHGVAIYPLWIQIEPFGR